MPAPTVTAFREFRFGNTTLNHENLFQSFDDDAIEAGLERAHDKWKRTAEGAILLAAHLLKVEQAAVDKIVAGLDTVDLGSGAGLITDEMDGGTQRAVYKQATRRNRMGAEDDMDAHLLTTPFGRLFHLHRTQYARRRNRSIAFV